MRGQVLGYDNGQGVINGDDGSRYTFTAADWKGATTAAPGATVDFIGADGVARDVYPAAAAASTGTTGSFAGGFATGAAPSAVPTGAPSDGSLFGRARNILLNPLVEWQAIAAQPMTVKEIMTYAATLSAIGYGIALVVGLLFNALSFFAWHGGFGSVLVAILVPLLSWALGLVIVYVMGLIAAALAPTFKGQKDNIQGLKLIVFAATAFWVANIFSFIPFLGALIGIAGALYGAYLIYLGSKPVMKVPEDSTIVYTLLTAVIWIVLSSVVYGVLSFLTVLLAVSSAAVGAATTGHYYGY